MWLLSRLAEYRKQHRQNQLIHSIVKMCAHAYQARKLVGCMEDLLAILFAIAWFLFTPLEIKL
jgi:hypothetical protein